MVLRAESAHSPFSLRFRFTLFTSSIPVIHDLHALYNVYIYVIIIIIILVSYNYSRSHRKDIVINDRRRFGNFVYVLKEKFLKDLRKSFSTVLTLVLTLNVYILFDIHTCESYMCAPQTLSAFCPFLVLFFFFTLFLFLTMLCNI